MIYSDQTEYRGAVISPSYIGFEWVHDNYSDAIWGGDGWDTFGMGCGNTIQDCKDEIDEMFEDLKETK